MTRTESILRARAEVQLLDWVVGILILEHGGLMGRVGLDLDAVVRSVRQDLADQQVRDHEDLDPEALRALLDRSLKVLEPLMGAGLKALRPLVVELYAAVARLRETERRNNDGRRSNEGH